MGNGVKNASIVLPTCLLLTGSMLSLCVYGFNGVVSTSRAFHPLSRARELQYQKPFDSSRLAALSTLDDVSFASTQLTSAVEVFDGSGVDPVVVSNVFWAGLKTKILSVIIGQFLAAAVFGVIASLAASQISKIGSFVSETILKEDQDDEAATKPFIKRPKSATVTPDFTKLLLCLVIDVIGTSSEVVPVLGEVTDVVWAPIAGFALRSLYGSNVLFVLEFAEEILPFTDILPLATLCWVVDTFYGDTDIAKALNLGHFSRLTDGVVDVESVDESSYNTDRRRLPGTDE